MLTFRPSEPPDCFNSEQKAWLKKEFRRIFDAAQRSVSSATFDELHAEPSRMVAGMEVTADGTDFDPGSGAGKYRRNSANTAWVFLG